MSHDLHTRAIVPDSLAACRMSAEQEMTARFWIERLARDEADRRYLLAVWLGDPLD